MGRVFRGGAAALGGAELCSASAECACGAWGGGCVDDKRDAPAEGQHDVAQACVSAFSSLSSPPSCHAAVSSNGQSWALRSKAALLLALVIRRAGAAAWEAGLDQLLSLAQGGPAFQGLVALVFKYVAEEVTQAAPDDIGVRRWAERQGGGIMVIRGQGMALGDCLDGVCLSHHARSAEHSTPNTALLRQAEAKRLLVNALTRTTPSVLGFLEMVLESGFRSLTDAAGSPAAREAEAAMHDALGACVGRELCADGGSRVAA